MNKLYITIAGKSNAGKSSFINHLCNNYVTPESSKLQTTRINTYHSFIKKNTEIIFIDTPGISVFKKDLMSDFMKKSYIKSSSIIFWSLKPLVPGKPNDAKVNTINNTAYLGTIDTIPP